MQLKNKILTALVALLVILGLSGELRAQDITLNQTVIGSTSVIPLPALEYSDLLTDRSVFPYAVVNIPGVSWNSRLGTFDSYKATIDLSQITGSFSAVDNTPLNSSAYGAIGRDGVDASLAVLYGFGSEDLRTEYLNTPPLTPVMIPGIGYTAYADPGFISVGTTVTSMTATSANWTYDNLAYSLLADAANGKPFLTGTAVQMSTGVQLMYLSGAEVDDGYDSPNAQFSGSWQSTPSVTYQITYTPFTASEYATTALNTVLSNPNNSNPQFNILSPAELAQAAYGLIVNLRDSGGVGNTDLRDAEYAFRGYAGGAIATLVTPNSGGTLIVDNPLDNYGPVGGLEGYNLGKYLGIVSPSMPGLPTTPPGGFAANVLGYELALQGVPIGNLPAALSNLPPLPSVSTDPANPMLPTILQDAGFLTNAAIALGVPPGSGRTIINNAIWAFNTLANGIEAVGLTDWLDPVATPSESWAVLDNKFMALTIPQSLLADFNNANISFAGYTVALPASGFLNFSSYVPGGVSDFQINGITGNDELVFGFNFAQAGDTLVDLISGLADSVSNVGGDGTGGTGGGIANVPEGDNVGLFGLFGLVAVGMVLVKRRSSALASVRS